MKVKLSQSAIEKMNGTKMRKTGFRINVRGIGWGGPILGVVQGEQRENDYVTNVSGINIYVAEDLIGQYSGFDIEYSSFFLTRGYSVIPRQNKSKC